MQLKKPILFSTLGFPGSGKTYLASRLSKDLNLFHLNSDKFRFEIFQEPKYTSTENKTVFRMMDFIAVEALSRGMSIIYDANSIKITQRQKLQDLAITANAEYMLLHIITPIELALERNKQRSEITDRDVKKYFYPVDENVIFRMKSQTELPVDEPFVTIDGTKSYQEQLDQILKILEEKGII